MKNGRIRFWGTLILTNVALVALILTVPLVAYFMAGWLAGSIALKVAARYTVWTMTDGEKEELLNAYEALAKEREERE